MSFFQRMKNKRSGQARTGATAAFSQPGAPAPRLAQRSRTTVRPRLHTTTGGGQALIQRPAPSQVKQKQQEPEQMHGSISMEEVMRDLQLVQAQQDESHHKLQQAQETKQRRVELHAALETKLEQLKYQNGQHRAELSHIRNLMSKGHRTLGMARLSTGRSGDDLRDFDRKLKQALASKQATLAHQSKQERMLSDLRNKVAIVWRLKDEANVQVDKYKRDIETLHKREEVIRHDIHKEKVQQQALDQEAASTRQDKSTLDQELHKMQQYEILAKSRIESINKDSAAMDKRHSETMESLRTKLGGHTESSKVTEDAILLMRQQITTKKQSVHETWHRMIHIQNSEGHYPSLPPTQSNTHPKFDITRLQEAAEADTKAVADEVAAKEELKISVDALEVKMADAESESQVKAQERQTLETANEEAGKLETTRREEADTFLKDLENLKKEKDTLDASISDIRSHRDTTQAIQEANKVHKRIRTLETKLAESKEELASTKACIEKSVADFEKAKAVDSSELDDIQATVDAEQQAYETAKDTAGRLIENSFNKNVDGIENSCRMLLEDTNADISRMLTEYPRLENVDIIYDPTLTAREQADKDLHGLTKICFKEAESAKKMCLEFDNAKESEDAERRKIERLAEVEAKRKQEARERRTMRLQANSSVLEKKQGKDDSSVSSKDKLKRRKKRKRHPPDAAVVKSKSAATEADAKPRDKLSAAKPRELLPSFTQTDEEAFNALSLTYEKSALSLTQEKKVRWTDDAKSLIEETSDAKTSSSSILTQVNPHRRQTFGTSSRNKSETSHSRSSKKREPSLVADARPAKHQKPSDQEVNTKNSSKHRSRSTSGLSVSSKVNHLSKPNVSSRTNKTYTEKETADVDAFLSEGPCSSKDPPRNLDTDTAIDKKSRKSSKDRSERPLDDKAKQTKGLSLPDEDKLTKERSSIDKDKRSKERSSTDKDGRSKDRSSTDKVKLSKDHSLTEKEKLSKDRSSIDKEKQSKGRSSIDKDKRSKDRSLIDKDKRSKDRSSIDRVKPTKDRFLVYIDKRHEDRSTSDKDKRSKDRSAVDKDKRLKERSLLKEKSSSKSKHESSKSKPSTLGSKKRSHSTAKSVQSSGISSQEHASKARRRKKSQTAGASKANLQSFGEDCSFDFFKKN